MKSCYKILVICLILSVSALGLTGFRPTQAKAEGITPMTIKLSSGKPVTDGRGMVATKFKEIIEKKTSGKIKVNLYLAGSLYGDKNEAEALSSGSIDMVSTCPYVLRRFDYVFSVGGVPDLFPDFGESWNKFWDDPAGGGAILKAGEKIGIHFFRYWYNTAPYLVYPTNVPIKKIKDFTGLKLRTPVGLEGGITGLGVGASPMAISSAEAVTAVQTRVVDGISVTNYHLTKAMWLGVTKYCTDMLTPWFGTGAVVASKVWWNKLSPEMKDLVEETVKEAVYYSNITILKEDIELREFMKSDKGYGKGFYDMIKEDPEEHARWQKLTMEGLIRQFKPHWSPSYIKSIEKATGKKLP